MSQHFIHTVILIRTLKGRFEMFKLQPFKVSVRIGVLKILKKKQSGCVHGSNIPVTTRRGSEPFGLLLCQHVTRLLRHACHQTALC